MLIIAIPKSASTSLLYTLEKLQKVYCEQNFKFKSNSFPQNCNALHHYHSDVRELTEKEIVMFASQKAIYKQHIFPSDNNIKLLRNIKKVILLRPTDEIILAYQRGVNKALHKERLGFTKNMTKEAWIRNSQKIGLTDDIDFFHKKWLDVKDANTLIIYYSELMDIPKETINQIETFFSLPLSNGNIELSKKKYSNSNRSSLIKPTVHMISNIFKLIGLNKFYYQIKKRWQRKKL